MSITYGPASYCVKCKALAVRGVRDRLGNITCAMCCKGSASADMPLLHQPTETSVSAAKANVPNRTSQRMQVLDFIRKCGKRGATDLEIEKHFGWQGSTVRPRRVELVDLGLITSCGKRPTPSGRQATVWRAK